MRTIKFRGVKVSDGEYVYGDLSHDRGHIFINDKRVKPESVAQLIGYDSNDEEVYEGDTLSNIHGHADFHITRREDKIFTQATLKK